MKTTTTIHHNTGYVSLNHNNREEELCSHEDHIDFYNKHSEKSYHENWYQTTLQEAYENIFGEAIEEYNKKTKRADRKMTVDSYIKSIEDDTRGKRQTELKNGKRVLKGDCRQGKQPVYEITATVGNTERAHDSDNRVLYDKNNHHIRTEEIPEPLCKRALKIYADTFVERNPNFIVVSMSYHADEGFYNKRNRWEFSTPHLHVAYIPVAHGFKQGLSIQNSMNKAMREMGFDDSNCYEKWAKREKEILDEILLEEYAKYCKENPDFYAEKGNLTIHTPVADRIKEGNKTKEQYQAEQELAEIIAETERIKKQVEEEKKQLEARESNLQARIDAWNKYIDKFKESYNKGAQSLSEAMKSIDELKAEYNKPVDVSMQAYITEKGLQEDYDNWLEREKQLDERCKAN